MARAALLLIGQLVLGLAGMGASNALARPVDLALVLAVDVSRSIDSDEFDLQRRGYVQALSDPRIVRAMTDGPMGAIAIAYVEWSGNGQQALIVDWTLIDSEASARGVAERIMEAPRPFAGYTSISGAIDFAMTLMKTNPHEPIREAIDISGDGSNNSGRSVTQARDEAVASGVTINGLAIMNDRPNPYGVASGELDTYYNDNVIGGPGAFVLKAEDFTVFASTILSKLIKEVAQGPADFGTGAPGTRLAERK